MTPIRARRVGPFWRARSLDHRKIVRWGFTEDQAHDRAFKAWEAAIDAEWRKQWHGR